jgi:Alw26I/Eco31I/Esp3I family type II restriction m6 adenine DNA methyltransferase
MAAITIEEALRKFDRRFYNYNINQNYLDIFSNNVNKYIEMTTKAIAANESEEHLKNLTNFFLKALYPSEHYVINTDKRIDSAIKVDGKVQAIIENKKPSNKSEMVTENNINVKALHEIIFYYMVETRDVTGTKVKRFPNTEIRRCIITDTQKWILIDANEVEKLVDGYLERLFYKYQNHQLIYSNNTDKFYADTKQYLDTIGVNERLPYIFFSLSDYRPLKKLAYLYKVFQKVFLLKESSRYNETTHTLNDKFYQELLYLMGLREKSGKSSKTIEIDHSIKNSLANQVYSIMKNDKEYEEIECVEKTFELVIIWMNRLLFIKLFEGQLITFNGDEKDYHILDNDKIRNFQNLQDLFFEVLGKRERESSDFINQFEKIPYLNSSLFERYDIEKKELNINALRNEPLIKKKNSVVGTKANTEIPVLEYLITFLNSYSFSAEISKNNTVVAGRDIIDASVLGLIFEKLNGYRDGSFYTPSVITEYMCMKSVEKAVIDKINATKKWECQDLFEIKSKMGISLASAKEINGLINEVKIGDISVGSGHFLVSALNRIIAIKKQLGVLFKYGKDELLTEYDIDVIDDVLCVYNEQKKFKYDKDNALSQKVQETLFNEKRIIIENCLFGVDLNPKAVAICQLRLWIELLKNAYYKNGVMETLPNIDINIKSGNSLINKLPFAIGDKIGKDSTELEGNTQKFIKQYKKLVSEYRDVSDKYKKSEIRKNIEIIKSNLHGIYNQVSLLIKENSEVQFDYGTNTSIYRDAFEWAIEFPELLNEKGVFVGFDCIIGNPPYGLLNKKQNQNTSISVSAELLEYYKNSSAYEWAKGGVLNIYRMFICRCFSLLKKDGHCCLIFPLAFMGDATNAKIRQYIMENTKVDFIEAFPERDNESKRVFKEVKMSVCILGATKRKVQSSYKFGVRIHHDKYVDDNNEAMLISYDDITIIDNEYKSIPLIRQHELSIFLKMAKGCTRMFEISKCYTGEVDISLHSEFITESDKDHLMLRGAQVQKYFITNDISQGSILYLKAEGYMEKNKGEKSQHHNRRRIVMQGITGINEKWRLKMTMAEPPYFCANSVNYLMPDMTDDFDYFILGILNSKLLNWYFAKLSTNSNVNGYEIDGLPIKLGTLEQRNEIIKLVKDLLKEGNENKLRKIDEIVYDIYGITEYEIPIIES